MFWNAPTWTCHHCSHQLPDLGLNHDLPSVDASCAFEITCPCRRKVTPIPLPLGCQKKVWTESISFQVMHFAVVQEKYDHCDHGSKPQRYQRFHIFSHQNSWCPMDACAPDSTNPLYLWWHSQAESRLGFLGFTRGFPCDTMCHVAVLKRQRLHESTCCRKDMYISLKVFF